MVDLDLSSSETSARFLAVPMLIVEANSILFSGTREKLPNDDVSVVLAIPSGRAGFLASCRSVCILCVPRLESRDCDADEIGLPLGTGSERGGPNRPWLLDRDPSWKSVDFGRLVFLGVLCGSLFLLRLSCKDSSYSD